LGHVIGDSTVLLVHLCPQKGQFSFFIAIPLLGDIVICLKTYPLKLLISHSKNLHLEKTKPNWHTLSNLERIYAMLKGFRVSEKSFRDYVFTRAVFKTSRYEVSNTIKEKVYKEWKFSFDAFGYDK